MEKSLPCDKVKLLELFYLKLHLLNITESAALKTADEEEIVL